MREKRLTTYDFPRGVLRDALRFAPNYRASQHIFPCNPLSKSCPPSVTPSTLKMYSVAPDYPPPRARRFSFELPCENKLFANPCIFYWRAYPYPIKGFGGRGLVPCLKAGHSPHWRRVVGRSPTGGACQRHAFKPPLATFLPVKVNVFSITTMTQTCLTFILRGG